MRLTQKNEFFEYVLPCQNIVGDNQATEISLGETEYTCKKYIIGEAIKKIGELEDVLEKYGIDNVKQLDNMINSIRTNTLIDIQNKEILELENANLRTELAELKQKAIVPKFEAGQIVYFNDDYGQILSGSIIAFDYYTSSYIIIDIFGNEVWRRTENFFTTKEEAEQKLAEINGEKDE